jgi:O-antigen/teichoic acid export membrane protein
MIQGVRKGSIYVLLGQGVASVFLFLFQMLAGRWLGVENYGLLNILYSAIFIVTILVISGVSQGLIRYIAFFEAKNDSEGLRQLIKTSFITYLMFLFGALSISILFKNLFLEKLFDNNLILLFQYLIGVLFLSLFRFYDGIIQGYRKFHIFSLGRAIKEFAMFGILVIIVRYLRLSAIDAGWSIAISPLIGLLFILLAAKSPYPLIKWKASDKLNPKIIRFILLTGLIALLDQWIIRLGPLLLKICGGTKADYYAGLFSAIIMPLNLARTVVLALIIALFPNLSRAYSLKDKNLIRRYILKSVSIVGVLVILIIPVYYAFGPKIVSLIFGAEYTVQRSDSILLALVISLFLYGILLSKIIMAGGNPKYPALSLLIATGALFVVFYGANFPPMKLVEIALLVCAFLYTFLQAIYLAIVHYQRNIRIKNDKTKNII